MRDRWNEKEAAGKSELELLVYRSRLIGADEDLVVWGGGNTSTKIRQNDPSGQERDVLWVKASGTNLLTIEADGFTPLYIDYLLPYYERDELPDEDMVRAQKLAMVDPDARRPSVEALLHAFVPQRHIDHSHADAIVALTNNARGREAVREALGDDFGFVPYVRPGFQLGKEVGRLARENSGLTGAVLDRHGFVTWHDEHRECYRLHIDSVTAAEEYIADRSRMHVAFGGAARDPVDPETRRRVVARVLPYMRGRLSREERAVLLVDDSDDTLAYVDSQEMPSVSQVGPATPDHLIRTKQVPLVVAADDPWDIEQLERAFDGALDMFEQSYCDYFSRNSDGSQQSFPAAPRVILVPGLGAIFVGSDAGRAAIVGDIYRHSIRVMRDASAIAPYASLSEDDVFAMEYWPLELAKLKGKAKRSAFEGQVVLVTGAASGIGRAACEAFLREGACVVATDIDGETLRRSVETFDASRRVIAVKLDVADEDSVGHAFDEGVLAFGGVDIVFSNAGIAPSVAIDEMDTDTWDRSMAVNARGHFLVVRAAMRLMKRQGLGGSIVLNASKNVCAPGAKFAAYSAAKSAETQLGKIAAIEAAEHGIRVNIVNADGVFGDSRLWTDEMRSERAAAHGVAIEELEGFYAKRNLLRRPVTAEDVAAAVVFLAGERSSKTTGCMLTVDGGVPAAFPR